ncbi:hypothetical protein RhiirC2_830368, partial [Rhizophagus irregularis]
MQTEIDSLRQRITELEAELEAKNSEIPELRKKLAEFEARDDEIHELRKKVAEVEAKNAELIKQMIEENNRRDARIEDLEKNKTDTTDRVTELEQKQVQNGNTPNNKSSNFNLGADQGSLCERPHHEKSLEDKKMDTFLVDANKKSIGEDIRRRNKEKKLQRESACQDSSSDTAYISGTVNNVEKTDVPKITNCTSSPEDELSHETGVIEDIANSTVDSNTINDRSVSEKSEGIGNSVNQVNDQDKSAEEPNIVTEFVQGLLEELLSDNDQLHTIKFYSPRTLVPGSISIKKLANSFCQANVGRNKTIVAKRSEITLWCLFSEKFEDKVVELRSEDKKLADRTARSQIYAEMKPYLTGVSDGYLRTMTCKARKINKLFGYEYDPVSLKKID